MKSLLLLAVAGLLTACQTPRTFPTPTPQWKISVGQLKYEAGKRTLIGEVAISRLGPDFQLEFAKGAGFPLLKLWISAESARAEGPLARGSWQGSPSAAPARLRHWLRLPKTFAAADAGRRSWIAESGDFSSQIAYSGSRPSLIRVSGKDPNEFYLFQLSR